MRLGKTQQRIVELTLRRGAAFGEGAQPVDLALGDLELLARAGHRRLFLAHARIEFRDPRPGFGEIGIGAHQRALEGEGIDAHQLLAAGNAPAFDQLVRHGDHLPGDERAQIDAAARDDFAEQGQRRAQIGTLDDYRIDETRLFRLTLHRHRRTRGLHIGESGERAGEKQQRQDDHDEQARRAQHALAETGTRRTRPRQKGGLFARPRIHLHRIRYVRAPNFASPDLFKRYRRPSHLQKYIGSTQARTGRISSAHIACLRRNARLCAS